MRIDDQPAALDHRLGLRHGERRARPGAHHFRRHRRRRQRARGADRQYRGDAEGDCRAERGGIDAKDIQTASFRVEPRYTRPIEGQAPKIDGYSVTNEVQVLVRDLDKLGDILDRLVTAGANQTAGLNFEVSKAETLLDEARQQAVANALRRAKLYATAAGAEVGEVLTIVEGGGEARGRW